MTVPLKNTFEGGTTGATITTGNSGGSSGNSFDTINVGPSSTITYQNSPVLSQILCSAHTPGVTSDGAEFRWDVGSLGTIGPTIYTRFYVNLASLPIGGAPNNRPMGLTISGTQRCALVFWSTPAGKFTWSDSSDSGGTSSTMTLATNTTYRFECQWTLSTTIGQAVINCYLGNSTSPLETLTSPASQNFGGTTMNSIGFGYRVAGTSSQYGTMYMDGLGIDTAGYLGPVDIPRVGDDPPIGYLGRGAGW